MTFAGGLVFVYRETWRFFVKAWWIAALPAVPALLELAPKFSQAAIITENLPITAIAWATAVNCIWTAIFYVFTRFLFSRGSVLEALSVDPDTCRTFLPFAVTNVVIGVLLNVGFEIGWGLPAIFMIDAVIFSLVSLWAVSAPGGGEVIRPMTSIRRTLPVLPWALVFWIVVGLPVGIPLLLVEAFIPDDVAAAWVGWASYGLYLLLTCVGVIVRFATIHVIARHLGLIIVPRRA